MPTGTISTILVIAIFCNLALMIVFLVGPLVRRRPAGVLSLEHFEGAATPDEAALPDAPREAVREAAPEVVSGGPQLGTVEQAADSREPGDVTLPPASVDTADEVTPPPASIEPTDEVTPLPAPLHIAGEAVPVAVWEAAPAGGSVETDEEEGDTTLERPETETERRRRFVFARHDDPRALRAIDALLSRPHGNGTSEPSAGQAGHPVPPGAVGVLLDGETGLESALGWDRVLREEASRYARYHRPVTIVVAELDGFERLVQRFGREAVGRLIPPIAATLRREARGADRLARTAPARLYALMPETDEIQAINYVERVRAQCDRWLEAGAIGAHVIFGWASPSAGLDLPDALGAAERRLEAERRLHAEHRSPAAPPAPRRPPTH